jgi:hypothetical protein
MWCTDYQGDFANFFRGCIRKYAKITLRLADLYRNWKQPVYLGMAWFSLDTEPSEWLVAHLRKITLFLAFVPFLLEVNDDVCIAVESTAKHRIETGRDSWLIIPSHDRIWDAANAKSRVVLNGILKSTKIATV